MVKIVFKRFTMSEDILEGMKLSKQEMIEKGLWHEHITLEEWAEYAGSHIQIKEDSDGQK